MSEVVAAGRILTRGREGLVCSIVVPAYNEEDGLKVVLEKLLAVIPPDTEIVVVDDGSTDRTADVARQFPVRLVQHEKNSGKGVALQTGIREAGGGIVIWTDADDTYPPHVIPDMIEALSDDVDLIYASRGSGRGQIPRFNRIGNALFSWSISSFYGFKPKDPCTGLCGVRREHLLAMNLTSPGFAIEAEIAMKAGRMKLRMVEMPITYGERIGEAKLRGLYAGSEISLAILRHLLWRPHRGG
jgi:glycosyltransferase involved in cell wall biosynthesis